MRTALGGPAAALLSMVALACCAVGCSGDALSSPHDAALGSPPDGATACTLIGCVDQFTATVTVDATTVPAGKHTLTVTIDGAVSSCSFNLPELASPVNDPCSVGFSLNVPGQPTDGKFTETIGVLGTPSSIEVHQTLDGTVVLDQTISPTYQTNQPNGPGCGPICRQATAAWTIP
jgi:hypothetical protein